MEERESLEQRTGFAGSITEYVDVMVEQVRQQVGDKRVLCALSGGVDSSVCAAIVHKAVGDQLVCVFVDHGLMRAGEPEMVDQARSRQRRALRVLLNESGPRTRPGASATSPSPPPLSETSPPHRPGREHRRRRRHGAAPHTAVPPLPFYQGFQWCRA